MHCSSPCRFGISAAFLLVPICAHASRRNVLAGVLMFAQMGQFDGEVLRLNFGPTDLSVPEYERVYGGSGFVMWTLQSQYFGSSMGGYWSAGGAVGITPGSSAGTVEGSWCSLAQNTFFCIIGVPVGSYRSEVTVGRTSAATNSCFSLASGESIYDGTTAVNEFRSSSALSHQQHAGSTMCLLSCRDASVINAWTIEKISCHHTCAFCTGTADSQCAISCNAGYTYTPVPAENKIFCTTVPSQVSGVPAVSNIQQYSLTLTWEVPPDGGLAITSFTVWVEFEGHLTKAAIVYGSSINSTFIQNLLGDTSYRFRVQAENPNGLSPLSEFSKRIRTSQVPPSAPYALQVDGVEQFRLQLSWLAPSKDGGHDITRYSIRKRTNFESQWATVVGDTNENSTSFSVTNLRSNSFYIFTVAAINAVGLGDWSVESEWVRTLATVPAAPDAPEVLEIYQYSVLLNWSLPIHDGGSPITSYTVDVINVPDDYLSIPSVTLMSYDAVTETPLAIIGLQGYHLYSFRVAASNSIGESLRSNASEPVRTRPIPPGPPGTPTIFHLEQYAMRLSWTRPAFDGGATVASYHIECREASVPNGPFQVVAANWHTDAEYPELRISDLIGFTLYVCRVAGINSYGRGEFSDMSVAARTLPVPPSTPGDPYGIECEKHALTIQWSASKVDVGSEILGYMILWRQQGEIDFTVYSNDTGSNLTEFYIRNLDGFTPYLFKVAGVNAIGIGAFSGSSNVLWTKQVRPSPPQAPLVFNITSSSFVLSWIAPWNGGSSITGYAVEVSEATSAYTRALWLNATELNAQIAGLLGSTYFRVRIVAVNAIAESFPGQATEVLTLAPTSPDPPTSLQVSSLAPHIAMLTWMAPDDQRGRPILQYAISVSLHPDNIFVDSAFVLAPGTSYLASGLLGSKVYRFDVQAVNEMGRSMISMSTATMLAPTQPAAPGAISILDLEQYSVHLSWQPPLNDGGARIQSYIIWAQADGTAWTLATESAGYAINLSAVVADLLGNNNYCFKLQARNSAGLSPMSAVSDKVRTKEVAPFAPGPPQGIATSRSAIRIDWDEPDNDGGFPIVGYRLWVQNASDTNWVVALSELGNNATSYVLSGLVPNTSYRFSVAGINALGVGPGSAASHWANSLPATQPDAPRSLFISNVTKSSMRISWIAPDSDGGSPILGYTIVFKGVGDSLSESCNTSNLSHQVLHLLGSTSYVVHVFAWNLIGASAIGAMRFTTTETPTPPLPPAAIYVHFVFPHTATISWELPHDAGGRPILEYKVHYATVNGRRLGVSFDESASISAGNEQSVNVTSLLGSTGYVFGLQARNGIGVSNISTSAVTTSPQPEPPAAPGQPYVFNVLQESATLAWTAPPHNGGAALISFSIWARFASTSWSLLTTTNDGELGNLTVHGLMPDTIYEFLVQAVNSVGAGPTSLSSHSIRTKSMPAEGLTTVGAKSSSGITTSTSRGFTTDVGTLFPASTTSTNGGFTTVVGTLSRTSTSSTTRGPIGDGTTTSNGAQVAQSIDIAAATGLSVLGSIQNASYPASQFGIGDGSGAIILAGHEDAPNSQGDYQQSVAAVSGDGGSSIVIIIVAILGACVVVCVAGGCVVACRKNPRRASASLSYLRSFSLASMLRQSTSEYQDSRNHSQSQVSPESMFRQVYPSPATRSQVHSERSIGLSIGSSEGGSAMNSREVPRLSTNSWSSCQPEEIP